MLINDLEWVTDNDLTPVTWDTSQSSNMVYHYFKPTNPLSMTEESDHAEDGTAYYATAKASRSFALSQSTYLP
jgi:hypothetical protein